MLFAGQHDLGGNSHLLLHFARIVH